MHLTLPSEPSGKRHRRHGAFGAPDERPVGRRARARAPVLLRNSPRHESPHSETPGNYGVAAPRSLPYLSPVRLHDGNRPRDAGAISETIYPGIHCWSRATLPS